MNKLLERISAKTGVSKTMLLFMVVVAFVAIACGMSDSIYSNYYKDAYDVTTQQRAFIEFPREAPGVLCVFIIAALSFLGDFKVAFIAQLTFCLGVTVLGLITPSFSVMLIFLFINSLGMHLFMPLQDSICMSLAEKGKVGKRMGDLASLKTAFACATGIVVFFGFRYDFFSFKTEVKSVFLIAAAASLLACVTLLILIKQLKKDNIIVHTTSKKPKFIFRYEYRYYYLLTVLNGVQKQIAYVFGSWVVIDLLLKGTDIMSLLTIASSFLGVFFLKQVGKWMDKAGIKFMMYIDALTFIIIYVVYGFVVWGISEAVIPSSGLSVAVVYFLFVLDRLSMQIGMVRSVYLQSIAVDKKEVTSVLSTGISLDHVVAIIAAQISGYIWTNFGPQWVFFFAAFFSLGNLFVASKVKSNKTISK
ncbi:MAG: MFS transporter [Clostridia bacterium]